jgi:hypothetical protein
VNIRLDLPLIAISIALLLLSRGAAAGTRTDAVVDRIEDGGWIVLDVPPHPSLPLPARIATAPIAEGDAVTVIVRKRANGVWEVRGEDARGLVLGDRFGTFHWPRVLAPGLAPGDRATFTLVPDPLATEARRAAIRSRSN